MKNSKKKLHSEFDAIRETATALQSAFGKAPQLAAVLGSGFSVFADSLVARKKVKTTDIVASLQSSVPGHRGELFLSEVESRKLLLVSGRVHGYEGHGPDRVVHLLRALKLWGIHHFILTNASGSTRLSFKPGDLALIKDHINFTGRNPLTGAELFSGPRFPDMGDAYSKQWRLSTLKLARARKLRLKQGVYMGVNGPSFETPAEIKAFAKLGADFVGMSTVWETIALRQMGASVLGLSCITNYGCGLTSRPLSHSDVLEVSERSKSRMIAALHLCIKSFMP